MLFRRREAPGLRERLRRAFWPRRGLARSLRYRLLRMRRLQASPHAVAIGIAAGVFAAFVPLPGAQMTLAAMLAWLLRGSMLAALAGTFVGMPWTYPFMWLASYRLGALLLGHQVAGAPTPDQIGSIWPLLKPLALGGIILGLVAGAAGYWLARCVVRARPSHARARVAPGMPTPPRSQLAEAA
jgi:hypothetical protein